MTDPQKNKKTHKEDELALLLQKTFHPALFERTTARTGEEAQQPLMSMVRLKDNGADTLLGSEDISMTSSLRGEDLGLLGSEWSWTQKEGHETLSSSLNNTADSETMKRKLSFSSARTGQTSVDTRWQISAPDTSTLIENAGSERAVERNGSASSRFSTSESESGDEWSASEEDEGTLPAGLDSLPYEDIIGRGAFGSVYKTTWKGQPAAIKIIEHEDDLGQSDEDDEDEGGFSEAEELDSIEGKPRKDGERKSQKQGSSMTATQGDQALLEAAMSSATHHPNVVQTYHYRTVRPNAGTEGSGFTGALRETHIVMEYCDCGSLEDAVSDGRLADSNGADINMELLTVTLLEVARALEYLHKMHITHRDLKLGNVLLKSAPDDVRGFTVKVSDFGLSRLLPDHSPNNEAYNPEYTGTITHMAPELLQHGGMSRAADVYSFGILMWEALMGEPAYHGISKMQVMFGVVSEELRPSFPPNTPPWYAQVATACWRQDPRRRPTFSKVCQKLESQWKELQRVSKQR